MLHCIASNSGLHCVCPLQDPLRFRTAMWGMSKAESQRLLHRCCQDCEFIDSFQASLQDLFPRVCLSCTYRSEESLAIRISSLCASYPPRVSQLQQIVRRSRETTSCLQLFKSVFLLRMPFLSFCEEFSYINGRLLIENMIEFAKESSLKKAGTVFITFLLITKFAFFSLQLLAWLNNC